MIHLVEVVFWQQAIRIQENQDIAFCSCSSQISGITHWQEFLVNHLHWQIHIVSYLFDDWTQGIARRAITQNHFKSLPRVGQLSYGCDEFTHLIRPLEGR